MFNNECMPNNLLSVAIFVSLIRELYLQSHANIRENLL